LRAPLRGPLACEGQICHFFGDLNSIRGNSGSLLSLTWLAFRDILYMYLFISRKNKEFVYINMSNRDGIVDLYKNLKDKIQDLFSPVAFF
jgi:hypothetical protein